MPAVYINGFLVRNAVPVCSSDHSGNYLLGLMAAGFETISALRSSCPQGLFVAFCFLGAFLFFLTWFLFVAFCYSVAFLFAACFLYVTFFKVSRTLYVVTCDYSLRRMLRFAFHLARWMEPELLTFFQLKV